MSLHHHIHLFANQLHTECLLLSLVATVLLQGLLDGLDLLGHGRQHTFLQTIELIKASPCSHLAQTNKDAAHGLEIECLITVEHQHKSSQLVAKSLYRLSLSSSSRT